MFDILNRQQSIHRNTFLEASAGTGKTFAIENIVCRLLLEEDGNSIPLSIENILVVTFTNAATRDLKLRVRANLEKSLHFLQQTESKGCPDYLLQHMEQGPQAVGLAIKRLENALLDFDRAQIFTIHGFCSRMLKIHSMECGISVDALNNESAQLLPSKLRQAVKDFLRTELIKEMFSVEQLNILTKDCQRDVDKLQEELLRIASRGISIRSTISLSEQFSRFQSIIQELVIHQGYHSKDIVEDFISLAPAYTGLASQAGVVHPYILKKVKNFADIFDKPVLTHQDFDILVRDGIFIVDALDASKLKKKQPRESASLHYPQLVSTLKESLHPLIENARNPRVLFASLASQCQKFLTEYQYQAELIGPNELLQWMHKAVDFPAFQQAVRHTYKAVIVDEFQDTDPLQWEIFSKLFKCSRLDWNGYLYFVGDPKQSIYAFRQADIYTYLSAGEALGENAFSTLETNFRSQPKLIEGLNVLFGKAKDLFPLPQLKSSLAYRPVKAGRNESLYDSEPCIEFWLASPTNEKKRPSKDVDSSQFFPAIAAELVKLKKTYGISLDRCAVLVSDRFQSAKLAAYLEENQIPYRLQKTEDLSSSLAKQVMKEILTAILHYRDRGALKLALCNELIGMNCQEIEKLDADPLALTDIYFHCQHLKQIWFEQGFAVFFSHLMGLIWPGHQQSLTEQLLHQVNGFAFYKDWKNIADLLTQAEATEHLSPEGVLRFLDDFDVLSKQEDPRIKRTVDLEAHGVAILTTHLSKGLEFDAVFALGLLTRTKNIQDRLILIGDFKKQLLGIAQSQTELLRYCEESDAEKMRQLYVALTRAKYRLYIPFVVSNEQDKKLEMGEASPIELLVARLSHEKAHYLDLYERINHGELQLSIESLVQQYPELMAICQIASENTFEANLLEESLPALQSPPSVHIPLKEKWIQSFTSLNTKHSLAHPIQKNETDVAIPHDFDSIEKTPHTLPAGAECGVILHRLLETLSFDCIKEYTSVEALRPLVKPFLENTSYASWEDVFCEIVFKALSQPFLREDQPFCLAEVSSTSILREAEFLFACKHELFGNSDIKSGFVKGVIDLFFQHEGKYYLVDWKSNWLGPSQTDYNQTQLQCAMKQHQYDLQAALYVEALQRYLNIFDKRPFDQIFGGIYYIFLRGLSAETGVWTNPLILKP